MTYIGSTDKNKEKTASQLAAELGNNSSRPSRTEVCTNDYYSVQVLGNSTQEKESMLDSDKENVLSSPAYVHFKGNITVFQDFFKVPMLFNGTSVI